MSAPMVAAKPAGHNTNSRPARPLTAAFDRMEERPNNEGVKRSFQELFEQAKKRSLSPAEIEAQRVSFAYGNAAIENDAITKQLVVECVQRLRRSA
jgi:hypothetical protein